MQCGTQPTIDSFKEGGSRPGPKMEEPEKARTWILPRASTKEYSSADTLLLVSPVRLILDF